MNIPQDIFLSRGLTNLLTCSAVAAGSFSLLAYLAATKRSGRDKKVVGEI